MANVNVDETIKNKLIHPESSWIKNHDVYLLKNYEKRFDYYRAMTKEEAAAWLSNAGYDAIEGNGHQGFSPKLDYSRRYMGNTYPLMLGFRVENYEEQAHAIGIVNGALEDGVLAYGIGWNSKNSIQLSEEANRMVGEEWEKHGVNYQAIERSIKAINKTAPRQVKIGDLDLAEKRKLLNIIYFVEGIREVQIVAIKEELFRRML